jgi:myo-inositol-1(or 4)-monophosphatase
MDYALELRCAEAIARESGHLLMRERMAGFAVEFKGPHDVVTRVDKLVEQHIQASLKAVFPNDHFHGEEYGVQGSGERVWVVDPIDGTLNFTRGIPMYVVSIALQVNGKSVAGVVYDVNQREMFSAQAGGGLRLNGRQVTVSETDLLSDSVLATGFPPPRGRDDVDNIVHFAKIARVSRNIRRLGSAALDLAYVAVGRLDGFWEFNLSPWDTAAGYLLVMEGGGQVTDHQGAGYTGWETGVVATNGRIHAAVLTELEAR